MFNTHAAGTKVTILPKRGKGRRRNGRGIVTETATRPGGVHKVRVEVSTVIDPRGYIEDVRVEGERLRVRR